MVVQKIQSLQKLVLRLNILAFDPVIVALRFAIHINTLFLHHNFEDQFLPNHI